MIYRSAYMYRRIVLFFILLGSFVVNLFGQSKPTTASDYNGTFQYAVAETNAAFPFTFTVVVEEFENGRTVSSETTVNERQAAGIERIARTGLTNGKKTVSYQVKVGFGNVYCSNDGAIWQGPQKYECGSGLMRLYGPRVTDEAEYSVEEKTVNGEKIKIYREYLIYKPIEGRRQKDFKETMATIDSKGLFISILNNEGTLDPKAITLIRKQSWDFSTKFKTVVAPK